MNIAPFLSVAGAGVVHSIHALRTTEDRNPTTDILLPMPLRDISKDAVSLPRPDVSRLSTMLPGRTLRRVPFYARMALLAAMDALDRAGWRYEAAGHNAIFLVLGTAFGCAQMSMDFMDSILENGPQLSSPIAFSHAVGNMGAGLLSLMLGIRGGCFTVSQFELSFAGALSLAAAILMTHRVDAVLAGAVDEIDARFTAACRPQVCREGIPLSEGAVFVCLTRGAAGLPRIRVLWGKDASSDVLIFRSGTASPDKGVDHEQQFGHGPLTQALDVMLALDMMHRKETAAVDCVCRSVFSGRQACIQIRSAP